VRHLASLRNQSRSACMQYMARRSGGAHAKLLQLVAAQQVWVDLATAKGIHYPIGNLSCMAPVCINKKDKAPSALVLLMLSPQNLAEYLMIDHLGSATATSKFRSTMESPSSNCYSALAIGNMMKRSQSFSCFQVMQSCHLHWRKNPRMAVARVTAQRSQLRLIWQ
jgi:hypothetical protein